MFGTLVAAVIVTVTSLSTGSTAIRANDQALGEPPSERITVDLVTLNGSGCPNNTARIATNPDNTGFSMNYDEYFAQYGPGSSATASRRNCQIAVQVHAPSDYTYALDAASYLGYGFLVAGATATLSSQHYTTGAPVPQATTHTLTGPLDDTWSFDETVSESDLVWMPCGGARYININTELRLRPGTSDPTKDNGNVILGDDCFLPAARYHLRWRRC